MQGVGVRGPGLVVIAPRDIKEIALLQEGFLPQDETRIISRAGVPDLREGQVHRALAIGLIDEPALGAGDLENEGVVVVEMDVEPLGEDSGVR